MLVKLDRAREAIQTNPNKSVPDRHRRVIQLADAGLSTKQISAETGLGQRQIAVIRQRERIRREAQSPLSTSARERLEAVKREHLRKLNVEFEGRVQAEVQSRFDTLVMPHLRKKEAEANAVIKARKGVFTAQEFKLILSALHTDRSISNERLKQAFVAFNRRKLVLLAEADLPTSRMTLAEWQAKRKGKRR